MSSHNANKIDNTDNNSINLITLVKAHKITGGIHPEQHKTESNQTQIEDLPIPNELWLPLSMHIGAAAEPCVTIGDSVLKGQIIAQAQAGISANIHAPTSGRITAIEQHAFAHESGFEQTAICIKTDGLDNWREQEPWTNWTQKSADELLERIRIGGITGLGGAGFPTHVKYGNKNASIHTLLINAAECEPYITSDDRLIREKAEEILQGAQICADLVGARTILIGIEDNKTEGIEAFKNAAQALNIKTSIAVVPTKYPSGGEKQLIQLTTGVEVPHKGLPSDVGIVCQNVGTLRQIYRTVVLDEPLISRVTTVTGKSIERPGNYQVLIGTSIDALLNHTGANLKKADRIIMGGPMMGFAVPDISAPIVKSTNCLLVPTKKELPPPMPDNPCIRCGMCEQACPVDLLPQQMLWASKNRQLESADLHSIGDCIECGACAYVCPSQIPLVQYFRYAKGELKQEREDTIKADQARVRFENRQSRLEREKLEKERRRKERSQAAAKALAEKKAASGEAESSPEDDSVKAALARAAAKKTAKTDTASTLSSDELKEAADKAKVKFEKASARLEDAKQNAPENVAALQKAVDKLEEKSNSTSKAYQASIQQEAP